MDADFWHQRWETNSLGFHKSETHPLLISYFDTLSIAPRDRVFVPLCGKTLDIAWLLAKDYRVAGVELSEIAVEQLFTGLGVAPDITNLDNIKRYSATDIDIFVGDIFVITHAMLGDVDAVFDRAALVALPEAMRVRYAEHLTEITGNATQLLITFEYDQQLMDGPPFSVNHEEIRHHYDRSYAITPLASVDVVGGLKGKCPAKENVWLLKA